MVLKKLAAESQLAAFTSSATTRSSAARSTSAARPSRTSRTVAYRSPMPAPSSAPSISGNAVPNAALPGTNRAPSDAATRRNPGRTASSASRCAWAATRSDASPQPNARVMNRPRKAPSASPGPCRHSSTPARLAPGAPAFGRGLPPTLVSLTFTSTYGSSPARAATSFATYRHGFVRLPMPYLRQPDKTTQTNNACVPLT